MTVVVNPVARDIALRQVRYWIRKLTGGEITDLGPEALHTQVCTFLTRAQQLQDDNAYIQLLRHFADELEVGVPLEIVDRHLNHALDDTLLTADEYVELANVRARLLMRRPGATGVLSMLHKAARVAETDYQHALLANREAVYWELAKEYHRSGVLYQRALTLARSTYDERGPVLTAMVLNNYGNWLYAQSRYNEALHFFRDSFAQATRAHSPRWQAAAAGGIAMTLTDLDEGEEAFEYHEKAEYYYRECGNESGIVRTNLNRSYLAAEIGRTEDAKVWGEAALEGARRLGDALREANALHNIGVAYRIEGQFDVAWRYIREALVQRRAMAQDGFTEKTVVETETLLADIKNSHARESYADIVADIHNLSRS